MLTDTKVAAIKPPEKGQAEHPDAKVVGLRLRVGAGGKKTWTLRKRVGAKTINRKLGTYPAMGLAKARTAALSMIEAIEATGSSEAIDRTFKSAAQHWLENKAKVRNKGWRAQERQLERYVYPAWEDRQIRSIKRAEVRDLIEGIDGKILPNRILALVNTIFRYSLARDWLEASPSEAIEKPSPERVRERVLSMEEIASVWRASELLGFPYGPLTRLLMLTGQRKGEVTNMLWSEIDLDAKTWTIPAEKTKSSRAQLVPLSPLAAGILDQLPHLTDYVFTTNGETPVNGFGKAKFKLDQFLGSRGEAIEDWRFHDLRRSVATHMVRLGISEPVVSRVLNHAAQGVTGKHYALHSYAPEKRQALELWAAEMDCAVNGVRGDNVVQIGG
ncbi:MAG: tyrosine-type recombinase/integrase [Pseudomonadota bacterium]